MDWAERSTSQEAFDRWPQWGAGRGVAYITAGLCWENHQTIRFSPTQGNPAHSDVVGEKTDSTRNKLAKGARLLILEVQTASEGDGY